MSSLLDNWTLKSKVFLVTGGTKGIGYATAQSILAHGAKSVIICSRKENECSKAVMTLLDEWKKNQGKSVEVEDTSNDNSTPIVKGYACDISTKQGREKLVKFVKENFDRLDGIVNNVGMNVRKEIGSQSEEEYEQMMRTNVDSVYFLCKQFKDLLIKTSAMAGANATAGAAIVNVASAAGVQSSGTGAVYGMSKAAVIHFSKILATEWAKYNIRVNAVSPWMTMTPMLRDAVKADPSQLDKVKEWTPMQRLAEPEEIANPIAFLLMPCSSYVTGQCLGIDGGLTAQGFAGPTIAPPLDPNRTS
jgi:Tropinone reductase 1|eukprot:307750_1